MILTAHKSHPMRNLRRSRNTAGKNRACDHGSVERPFLHILHHDLMRFLRMSLNRKVNQEKYLYYIYMHVYMYIFIYIVIPFFYINI